MLSTLKILNTWVVPFWIEGKAVGDHQRKVLYLIGGWSTLEENISFVHLRSTVHGWTTITHEAMPVLMGNAICMRIITNPVNSPNFRLIFWFSNTCPLLVTTCYEAMLSDSLITHILYLIFSFQTAEYSVICLFIGIILHRCMSTKPCSWCLQSKSRSHQYLHFSYFVLQHEWKTLHHLIVCFFFWKAPGQTIPDFIWTLLYLKP